MSAEERRAYIESLADWLLLAREATLRGLRLRPDVAVFLKWSAIGILGQAYLAELRKEWDFSEAALRAQYEAHAKRYAEEDAVRLRWCVAPAENRANRMLLDLLGESPEGCVAAGDRRRDFPCLAWNNRRADFHRRRVCGFSSSPAKRGAPSLFRGSGGSGARGSPDVYLQREMERVRQKANISMDEMVLMDLGNIPAR
jgi:hypothetical protein